MSGVRAIFIRQKREDARDRFLGIAFVALALVVLLAMTHYLAFWLGGYLAIEEVKKQVVEATATNPAARAPVSKSQCVRDCYTRVHK